MKGYIYKYTFPARIGAKTKGSIILDKNVVSAKYLLSYNGRGQKLYRIDTEKGIKIVTKDEMIKKGYVNPHHSNYMLYHLAEAEAEFSGMVFDVSALKKSANKNHEAFPFNLVELLQYLK